MTRPELINRIQQLIDAVILRNSFQRTYYEDGGTFVSFYVFIDDRLGFDINIDFVDHVISFYMIRLNNGKLYQHGFSSNKEAGTIRLYFQDISKYFNLFFDKKKSSQLMDYDKADDIPIKVSDALLFYQPIFQNEAVLTELHNPAVWEQIKRQK